jgi:uncharacterized protein DUF3987
MSARYTWADPDESLLEDTRGDLPGFPDDVLPPRLLAWLERAAYGAGVRTDHVAIPLLGVASSLIGTARRVRASSSWTEPLTLWTCLIGVSGERKTSAILVTKRALDLIEKDNEPTVDKMRHAHQARIEQSREELKQWREARQKALEAKPPRDPPPMPADLVNPGAFIHPRLYATDPTTIKLAAMLTARPRGMMLIRDELSGLFGNMQRYSGNDRPFWLEAWNGARHVVERFNQSIPVPHLLIGVIGGFQPDKLARAFHGDEDGMYGRFLYGWPAPLDYRPLVDDIEEVDPAFQNMLIHLIRLPAEDNEQQFAPRSIPLSRAAVDRFEEYRQFVDRTKRGLDGREQHWFAKSETQVLRLAGTLAYIDWAGSQGASSSIGIERIAAQLEPNEIVERFMVGAIRLIRDYFWPHARAALRQIGLTDRHKHVRKILRWIKTHGREQVSLMDVRREALGGSLDAEQTEDLLDRMEMAGWLRRDTAKTGGRPRHRWLVNPKLFVAAGTAGSAGTSEALDFPALPAVPAIRRGGR